MSGSKTSKKITNRCRFIYGENLDRCKNLCKDKESFCSTHLMICDYKKHKCNNKRTKTGYCEKHSNKLYTKDELKEIDDEEVPNEWDDETPIGTKASNKCKYTFKRGSKEGKTCNKPCRGEFCKDHNSHKLEYNKKYYSKKNDKKSRETFKDKIKRLKTISINKLQLLSYYQLRYRGIEEKIRFLLKEIRGLGLIVDPETWEPKVAALKPKSYMPNSKVYFEYSGSLEDAEKKLEKKMREKEIMIERLKQYKQICDIVEKRYIEHNKNN